MWMRMTVSPSGWGCCASLVTFTQKPSGPSTSIAMRLGWGVITNEQL